MDVNSSDQNGKPSINNSAEDPKENKENKNELPPILRPKFSKRRRRRRLVKKSRETVSRDDDATGERNDLDNDKDDEKPSVDRPSMEKPSMEKPSAERGGAEPDGEGRGGEGRDSRDSRDSRDNTRERETEELECRDSETDIVVVNQQNSGTDIYRNLPTPAITMEDKSDEKKKKKRGDSLDECEPKKKKDLSKRKRRGHKKGERKHSGRKHSSDDRKKKKKQPTQRENLSRETVPSPRQSTYAPLKNERSAENIAAKKSKANHHKSSESATKLIPSPDKKTPQQPPQQQKKKFNTFFKSIFDKTKFWMRKSDDVAQPTKEMLFKSYVSPEYGYSNSNDFHPDPSIYLPALQIDLEPRLKNAKCEKHEVFINNRPFWVHRTPEDVIPKAKLLSHASLIAQHTQNNGFFLKELPKRTFYDPKKESIDKLMAIDKVIGVDTMDPTKEKELKRVTSNTFYGTCHIHSYRISAEGKRKSEEFESKYIRDLASDDKKSGYGPRLVFQPVIAPSAPDKSTDDKTISGPMLNIYTRKARPAPGKVREFRPVNYIGLEPSKKPSKHKEVQVIPLTHQESHHIQAKI